VAFPEAPRVRYKISPLVEVVCQLKFPPILKIEAELPAAFQEKVRTDFPLFETVEADPSPHLPPELARFIPPGGISSSPIEHLFSSDEENRTWTLGLGRSKLGLSTSAYGQWEEFRQKLAGPHAALIKEYQPAPFNHVCLRYRNIIRRSLLPSLEPDVPWSELLRPPLCGFLAAPELQGEVVMTRMTAGTRLPDGIGWLDVQYGLVQEEPDGETAFRIDVHLFNHGPTEPTDAFDRLDALHRQAGSFFRWCITDRLHDALDPRPVAMAILGRS